MKDIKIMIAAHKKYDMPTSELYLPLHVGAELSSENLEYQKDNEGENISSKNPYFCELTGIYFAWKNLKNDYVGLVHYRRYFGGKEKFVVNGKTKKVLKFNARWNCGVAGSSTALLLGNICGIKKSVARTDFCS